ncbi:MULTISPECIES: LacI family DNA-binding transcriptional regulator [Flavobacterium]|uniref:HTH lacI-type domain-containing protein n=1 Tax=Flavobacterium hankyongi TaxID=1176532 RepID=A0ABP8ZN28_9FLAO|nr:LacI family DNA-binding transcriptional regulator [Flavobacterium sp. N1846]
MITLKKIAHVTGYSVSTISKALNGRNDISEEAKKTILDFAKKNQYVPNKNAIALRRCKSNNIAVILPQINHKFYSEALSNMQRIASKKGYRIMLFQSFEERAKEIECLNEVKDGSVDGVIILSVNENQNFINTYRMLHSIPVQFIQISENQPLTILNENCISDFKNLLKKIN